MHSARSTLGRAPSRRGSRRCGACSSGKLRWQWESTNMAHAASPRGARRRAPAQIVCVGLADEIEVPSDLLDLQLAAARVFSSVGKAHADALGAAARGIGRRDPADLAGHRIALRIVGQRQQQVDVLAELVVARGRHEQAAVGEQRHVGGVQRALLAEHQLDHARPRAGGAGRCARRRGARGGRSLMRGECIECDRAATAPERGVGQRLPRPARPALRPAARRSTGCSACARDALQLARPGRQRGQIAAPAAALRRGK